MSKKVKRILVLGPGDSEHMHKLIRWYLNGGYEVVFFTLYVSDYNLVHFRDVELHRLNINQNRSFFSKIVYLRSLPILLSFNFEVVHAHYISSYGLLSMFVRCRRRIVSVWGSDILVFPERNVLTKLLVKFVLSSCDTVLATSKILKEKVLTYSSKSICSVTPFGVDTDLFAYRERNLVEPYVIGIVKSLKPVYRLDIFIRTISILRNEMGYNVRAKIVGEGPLKHSLYKLCMELDISDNVEFTGFVPNSELAEILDDVHLGLFPSDSESFGVSVLEMGALGIPSIAHSIGGFKEIILEGFTGFTYFPNDAHLIAEKISKLIFEDPNGYRKLSISCKEHVNDIYSEEKTERMFLLELEKSLL